VLPEVPAARELGHPNLETAGYNGFFASVGTPGAVVARLHAEIVAAAAEPALRARILDLGGEPDPISPAAFAAILAEQIAHARRMVAAVGLAVD